MTPSNSRVAATSLIVWKHDHLARSMKQLIEPSKTCGEEHRVSQPD
jgi:hypothetical protein